MSRHSRHRSRERSQAVSVAARKTQNLRDFHVARREYLHERRQFDKPSIPDLRLPNDLFSRSETTYLHDNGRVANTYRDTQPRDLLPQNNNEVRVSQLPPVHTYFSEPKDVNVCRRRQIRRRVLFALSKTRKGSGRGKKHYWTEKSKIRCV